MVQKTEILALKDQNHIRTIFFPAYIGMYLRKKKIMISSFDGVILEHITP